ncbi:MAG: hypothetical protein HY22_08045 [[Candidatus Thermochlorobacteriaceae] bacterium GBChlB]|nr:MAG: hypothetical protein HY22_08045 [[Candidatus Thermochlorobacteriaceae] bacterium GBChlB]
MYQSHYSKFLAANPNRLHFAAHSHHLWLDVTREAQLQYWDDSAAYVDKKWAHIFSEVVPKAQQHIAAALQLSFPEQIVFAPNTHEFVARLLSCLDWTKPVTILTTDSEFYSFTRQLQRLEELPELKQRLCVRRIAAEPFETFESRFIEAIEQESVELIFFSHVFFNSGFAIADVERIVKSVQSKQTMIVIDGYHGFMAMPTSLSAIESRVFYLSGGYKYAQAGEGVCFLAVPKGSPHRPIYTGWFAEFGKLADRQSDAVPYSDDGFRFAGATLDPSGLYRFNAAMDWLAAHLLTVDKIHAYVQHLQQTFFHCLDASRLSCLSSESLVPPKAFMQRGHFLTFNLPNAATLEATLLKRDIVVDRRGERLRFGFGLYQTEADIEELFKRMKDIE